MTFSTLREHHIRTTRELLQASVTQDILVISAFETYTVVQQTQQHLLEKLKTWYALYNPEFLHQTLDDRTFVETILVSDRKTLLYSKTKVNEQELSSRNKRTTSESVQKHVPFAITELGKKQTSGGNLTKEDLKALQSFATLIKTIFDEKTTLEKYLETVLKKICLNTQALLGTLLTAELLTLAGSLKKLATMPASTIQLLGAEKAMFRHLKEGAKSPKHGILYNHSFVQKFSNKGKAARTLADKIAITARVDYFKGEFIADKLTQELEKKVL